jgi:hypothetical protein
MWSHRSKRYKEICDYKNWVARHQVTLCRWPLSATISKNSYFSIYSTSTKEIPCYMHLQTLSQVILMFPKESDARYYFLSHLSPCIWNRLYWTGRSQDSSVILLRYGPLALAQHPHYLCGATQHPMQWLWGLSPQGHKGWGQKLEIRLCPVQQSRMHATTPLLLHAVDVGTSLT